ncbi:MAG: hypothetical protein ACOYNS_18120 [Bacteroidota bacterium]
MTLPIVFLPITAVIVLPESGVAEICPNIFIAEAWKPVIVTSWIVLKLLVNGNDNPAVAPTVPNRMPIKPAVKPPVPPKLIFKFLKVFLCAPLTGTPFNAELFTEIPMLNFLAAVVLLAFCVKARPSIVT